MKYIQRLLPSSFVLSYCLCPQIVQAEQSPIHAIAFENPLAEERIFSQNQEEKSPVDSEENSLADERTLSQNQEEKYKEKFQATTCGKSPHPYYFTMRHIEGNGVGYNQGYTSLVGFFRPVNPETWVPFLDVRYHFFNNGKPAVNAGLGLRYLGGHRIWGINGYYDYRKTSHQHYNQISVGLESLGKIWDFRINGYLPVGKKTSGLFDARFDRFMGHYLYIKPKYEFAMKGANAEIGAHINRFKNVPFYFAIGPYYLENKGKVAWGGEARLSATLFGGLRLEGNASYDNVFKWIGQGQVSLVIPFGTKKDIQQKQNRSCSTQLMLASRSVQPVDRNEIIVLDRNRKRTVAIDPSTGQPYYFVFVDNQSSSDGTFESPYPTLALAQANSAPNQIIYVFPGDGTTNGMNAGITLQLNQKFWGAGNSHNILTTLGSITIPMQSSTEPQITNTLSDCVVLASGNDVSGFNIVSANGNGIFGSDATNVHIDTCLITNSSVNGVELDYSGSTVASAALDHLTINGSANDGVLISGTGTPSITVTFSDSEFGTNFNNEIEFVGNFATANVTIANNIMQSGGLADGIEFFSVSGTDLNLTVSGNQIYNNSDGVVFQGEVVTNNILMNGNLFANNTSKGVRVLAEPATRSFNVEIDNNQFIGNSIAMDVSAGFNDGSPSAISIVTISNNRVDSPGDICLRFMDFANSIAPSYCNITGNTFNNAGNEGVLISTQTFSASLGTSTYNISDNVISNSSSNGIRFDLNDDTPRQVVLNFQNNEISNSGGNGFISVGSDHSITNAFIANNTISNSAVTPGVAIENTAASSSICLTLENNNSDSGYLLFEDVGAGNFSLAPLDVDSLNTGTITRSGTIDAVSSCP
jgi:trimeric autotransporter adhesin